MTPKSAGTAQLDEWCSNFGKEYTERNNMSLEDQDAAWMRQFGLTRSSLNEEYFGGFDRQARILEVGCNIGLQLMALRKMGFKNLFGIEPQAGAIETARKNAWLNAVQATAFDLPFKNGFFDLVYTSGVLIHISPKNINDALDEIHRCSGKFIIGMEYFSEKYQEVPYRGKKNLLWKGDFAKMYLDRFKNLVLVRDKTLKYSDSENVDKIFVLEKK